MRLLLCLLVVSCAFASEDEGRAKKPPFVVDAVGNTLPPPSNVPATVGSPVNLISPDRYEFYTFDESGELVKRLMTLAQIQAIVAAGEEAEGLVTFANDNQPTVAFNFSQPSHNKVHSVVTNVQNVLKAQMEAHKKNPLIQPALDTPDVSDSWSLILPSIFGNTGLDIVPDKTPNAVTPPETDTLEFHDSNFETNDISFSKEGNNEILSSSTTTENNDSLKHITTIATSLVEEDKATPTTTEKSTPTTTKIAATTSTTTTTAAPPKTTLKTTTTTTTTTNPPSTTSTTTLATTKATERVTTTLKPLTTKATVKLTTAKDPQTKLTTLTTKEKIKLTSTTEPSTKPFRTTEVSSTTKLAPTTTAPTLATKTRATTSRPYVSSTSKLRLSTTVKPASTTKSIIKFTPKITTFKPSTTKKHFVTTTTTPKLEININNNEVSTSNVVSTENNTVQYEKKSTYIPISTATYITERTTQKPQTARPTIAFINTTQQTVSTTTAQPSTTSQKNLPVITTYKPTTTESAYVSSTAHNQDSDKLNATTITTQSVSPSTTVSSTEFLSNEHQQEIKHVSENLGNYNKEPDMPLFDVAQSISQIASDLGSNYIPLPTVSNIDVSTTLNDMDLESKENIEMDILTDIDSNLPKPNVSESDNDNFVKISTIDPHPRNENKATTEKDILSDNINSEQSFTTEKNVYTTSTLESTTIDRIMSESMGDLLFQVVNQAPQSIVDSENKFDFENNVTTETSLETTTNDNVSDFTTTTIEPLQTDTEKYQTGNDIPEIQNRISELTTSIMTETTEISIIEKEVNSTENEKTEEVGNTKYVQISASAAVISTESDIKPEFFFVSNETENKSVKNNDSTVLESTKKEEVNIATLTNKTQNIESSTTDSTLLINMKQEIKNKTSIVDANKNKKNDQLPLLLPKIDEFKKKIQKVNIDDKELANDRNNSWKLISTVSPPKSNEIQKTKEKNNGHSPGDNNSNKDIILNFSKENQGLEVTTKDLEEDIAKFTELCNELAFRYWNTMIENIDKRRSFVLSPYSITSMLAMMFMGARGATSGEMNDILKLDDMVTFNPHFTLKNISDSIETTPESGVIVSAFIRELYSDRTKGKILTFYKERAQQFYNGHVEEINFKLISDIIRRRTNLLVKRYTWGKISEYMKSNTITMQPPLAAFSANIFQTDCSGSSVEGRDGEMYFVVSPTVRQRRLVPVPAVVYRSGFLAGYDPVLDATAAALGKTSSIISTLFVMPGQQGNVVHGEDLEALEQRLLDANPTTPAWNRLLRTLLPRIGLELQIPRFSHKSIFNVSDTLRDMGLKDLFDSEHADLGGLNGPSKDLYLSDMIQSTTFVTCGEDVIGEQHHVEEYPETLGKVARRRSTRWTADWSEPRDYQRAFHDPHDVGEAMHLPLHLRPRQARLPSRNAQPTRLKFDRPFLYFVRHNPSGMILYVGRYNPRLLP